MQKESLLQLWNWVRRHSLVLTLVGAFTGALGLYGAKVFDAIAVRLLPPAWIAERIIKSPPTSPIETGSIKPALPTVEQCQEKRRLDIVRLRPQVDTAKSDIKICIANQRRGLFPPSEAEARASPSCDVKYRAVVVLEDRLKSADARRCQ